MEFTTFGNAMTEAPQGTRINKYLSEVGHCSRRAADKLLEEGRITLNGKVPELGTRVQPGDCGGGGWRTPVAGNDQERIVIAYHKPVGIVCTTDQRREKDNIIDAINFPVTHLPRGAFGQNERRLDFFDQRRRHRQRHPCAPVMAMKRSTM